MTLEEKEMIKSEIQSLAKQCLSISEIATAKDDEIMLWIGNAILDLERQGINVSSNIEDECVRGAIIMYVKANFGMTDIKEKENAQRTYIQTCNNLSLSDKYKMKEVDIDA